MNLADRPSQYWSSFGDSSSGGTNSRSNDSPTRSLPRRSPAGAPAGDGFTTGGLVIDPLLERQQTRRPDHDEPDYEQQHRHPGHRLVDLLDPDRETEHVGQQAVAEQL